MRMYFLHTTITLLVVIAHVQCGTLRQYGPDWLIPKPEPQVDSKRITAKSVFIAPSFQAQNVRCASGFREDSSGRCVKLVHVNQAAQLDFLLQRLNAMYGAPVVNDSEKQPLQVSVGIPVESSDGASVPQTEEMYSQAFVPQGEVSVDLLPGAQNQQGGSQQTPSWNTTEDVDSQSATVKNPDEAGLTTVLPVDEDESKDNETDTLFVPNKEMFQVDEEPLVTLTYIETEDDEDSVENTTVQAENVTVVETLSPGVQLPDTLLSVNSEDVGVMANITKNSSNMIKKETSLGDSSVTFKSESNSTLKMEASFLTNQTFNETQLNQTRQDTTVQSEQMIDMDNEQVSHDLNTSADVLQPVFTTTNDVKSVDESTGEVPTKSSGIENVTSFNLVEATTLKLDNPVTSSSIGESSSESSTAEVPTTQLSKTQNFTDKETITSGSTTRVVITALPTTESNNATTGDDVDMNTDLENDHNLGTSGDRFENMNNNTNEDEYDFQTQDVDVEPELPDYFTAHETGSVFPDYGVHNGNHRFAEHVPEGSADHSLVPSSTDSVEVDSNTTTVNGVSDMKNGSEVVENNVSVKTNTSLIKTETSGVTVPSSNGTKLEESFSASQTISTGVEIPTNVSGEAVVHQEVLKADSTVPNVEIIPYEFSETVHNLSQQVPVITPEHSVQVVYPQPIIQVINVKQDPQIPPIYLEKHNEPSTVFKESVNQNFTGFNLNLIPNLVQNPNYNPLPQMPLVERAPELPPKYGGYPYPPLPPLNENHPPNTHPHHRPQYPQHNPYPYYNPPPQHYPPDNLNPSGPSGFVRFPTENVQPHHHHQHHVREDEVNTVRFPLENVRSNDKYSRWDWRLDETRGQRPTQRYWAGGHDTQYPHGTNRRNYWVDNRPNRRRPQQNRY